ncbi:Flagellar basal-body rod protein FlgB [hydrothermal vent metagenome]|uniref:Flagellar basal-body rod protein FlgB n=1 Tax=hydrothermal vent metagenome TaxID=652676 RepID=A0A3B0WPV0_9ZZZZ
MPISFDSALGVHQKALAIRSQRTEILASNIANADTPGYKARDIDFKSTLANIDNRAGSSLTRTNAKHIQISTADKNPEMLYRTPNQSSLDGNTVDGQLEKSAFAENALRYQASLTFLSGKFKGMLAAIKGE